MIPASATRPPFARLALAAALACATTFAFAAEVGQVKTSKGEVTIERAGAKVPGPVGTKLEASDILATGADGAVRRYAVKDPSFNNWTGLAVAARGEVVSDFPLCNKSFGLSYSGNDL